MNKSDHELLTDYARTGSEEAFTTLVNRHINLVYSAARRQIPDGALAQDIVQAVFIVLARNAGQLDAGIILSAWLLRATRFAVLHALRTERRHQRIEEQMLQTNDSANVSDFAWEQVEPFLDEGLARLNSKERAALALRFFESRTFGEVAGALGTSEDAAKKRVARGLEKLRLHFQKRNICTPIAVLGAALATQTVSAAPLNLGALVAGQSLAPATNGTATILANETSKALLWAKLKSATLGVSAGIVLLGAVGFTAARFYSYEETPKAALRNEAKRFRAGNGRAFVRGLFLTHNRSAMEGSNWGPALAEMISAQGAFRKAALDRFGADAVREAMPFWDELDNTVAQLLGAPEQIDGARAKFPLHLFGQTAPGVPILIHTNGGWKLALDLSVRGGAKMAGKQTSSFQLGFAENGVHLGLTTRLPVGPDDIRHQCKGWAESMQRLVGGIRAGQFANATAAAAACSQSLETAFHQAEGQP